MAQNYVKETFQGDTNWVCPAGVTRVVMTMHKLYRSEMAGVNTSVILDADGAAWAFGQNTSGELGNNSTVTQSSPVAVAGALKFVSVSSRGSFANTTLAMTGSGVLYAWGSNTSGQIGDNTVAAKSVPTAVLGTNVVQQQPFNQWGGGSGNAIGYNLDAYAWGENFSGQLGDNTVVVKSTPVLILGGRKFRMIGGNATKFAITEDGTGFCWGNAFNGALGDNTIVPKSTPVLLATNTKFKYITGGGNNGFGIAQDGTVWGWGEASNGGYLPGYTSPNGVSSPVLISLGLAGIKMKKISLGGNQPHIMALSEDGDLYGWGADYAGQTGTNSGSFAQSTPTLVVGGKKWMDVHAGVGYTIGIDTDGKYWAWGRDTNGRMGLNDSGGLDYSSPVAIVATKPDQTQIKFVQPKKLISRFNLDVVPGVTYPIKCGDWFGLFNNSLYGVDVQEVTLEYYG